MVSSVGQKMARCHTSGQCKGNKQINKTMRKTYPVAHVRDNTFEPREAEWRAKLGLSQHCPKNVSTKCVAKRAMLVFTIVATIILAAVAYVL